MSRIVFVGSECLLPEIKEIGKDRFLQAQLNGLNLHSHKDCFEICYLVQGSVLWWVEGKRYAVQRGDIFITKPDELHGGVDNLMHPCELYWIKVQIPEDGSCLSGLSLQDTNSLAKDFRAIHHHLLPGTQVVEEHFNFILGQHQRPLRYAAPLVRAKLHQLLIYILQAKMQYFETNLQQCLSHSGEIKFAVEWIETHLAEKYLVTQLAQTVNMSVSQFHKRFLQEIGITPAEYRTRRQIALAKELLCQRDGSIMDVALQVGFSTSQYFATVFKKFEGVTPQEFRRRKKLDE